MKVSLEMHSSPKVWNKYTRTSQNIDDSPSNSSAAKYIKIKPNPIINNPNRNFKNR